MEPDKPQGTETETPDEVSRFEQEMLKRLAEALKEGHLKSAIQCIHDNHLIPIWYAPFMFCGKPGDPQALPNPQEMGPCLRKSARVIAWMVVEDILPARDPDTWMPLAFEPVTPDWLVKWSDLEEAAIEHMGLRTGYIEALEGGTAEVSLYNPNKSAKLAVLERAAIKFWGNADVKEPDTYPKTNAIIAWLVERGYSHTLAEKAVSIIRPEGAKKGRRPE